MNLFIVIIMAMTPLIEQRGAIPFGIFQGYHPLLIFFLALIGSLLPVPVILLLFNKIYQWLIKYPIFNKLIRVIDKKIAKNQATFEKYQEPALIIFIGIPLPTTGLWTGSVIAAFLKLDFKKSLACALVGGTISAAAITLLSVWLPAMFKH